VIEIGSNLKRNVDVPKYVVPTWSLRGFNMDTKGYGPILVAGADSCFRYHQAVESRDFVSTRYAP